MRKLLAYLNNLPSHEQSSFAERCGTSVGYIRKAISTGQKLGEGLVTSIEKESRGEVLCDGLREDVSWVRIPDPDWPHPNGRPLVDHSQRKAA